MLENNLEFLLKDIYTTFPFRTMALTNGEIPEDPYDYWTWGDVVVYIDRCIDEEKANKVKKLFLGYLRDLSLLAATKEEEIIKRIY